MQQCNVSLLIAIGDDLDLDDLDLTDDLSSSAGTMTAEDLDIWNSRPQRQSSRRQSSPATDGPKDSRPISQRQSSHDDSRPERQSAHGTTVVPLFREKPKLSP